MNKKAFTLVELLMVVIVLGLLLAIAIPRIAGVVDVSKRKTFEISAESLIKELSNEYIKDNFNITKNGKTFVITNNSFVGDALDVKGDLPDNGTLYINETGKTAFSITKENYCAVKDFYDDDIVVSDNISACILNIPEPVLDTCFTYTTTATDATITAYSYACSKNVIIPETLGGLPVTKIGYGAFSFRGITSLSLPSSLTILDAYAFYYNSLKYVDLPDGLLEIKDGAFRINNLETITIPDSVNVIGYYAFLLNNLTSYSIPDKKYYGGGIFNNNNLPDSTAFVYDRNLDGSINYSIIRSYGGANRSNVIIPAGVTTIESYAFMYNELTSVTIPSGVTSIYWGAFKDNALSSLVIPSTVINISPSAFTNNMLPDAQAFVFARNPDGSVNNTDLRSYGGSRDSGVVIPSTVTTISSESFLGCGITSVTIPSSVTTIGSSAFSSNSLTSLTIPSSVTSISSSSFASNLLTNVVMPLNVTIQTSSISTTFYTTYVTNNARAAGTYTAPSQTGTWTKL